MRRQGSEPGAFLKLWMYLLQRLLVLCRDERQEARDGAIQILWRSIELYGAGLDAARWEECLSQVIFPLLDDLDKRLEEWQDRDHGHDAPLQAKQWDDSKILAVNSVGGVFADELVEHIAHLPSFETTLQRLVAYLQTSFLKDRAPVATAAMKALGRIAGVQWPADKNEKGRFVVERAYLAWSAIGQAAKDHQIFTLTQSNLEAYNKVYPVLQQSGLLESTEERTQNLLATLKGVITYPFSTDYRPDTDVLPPVQASAFEVFTSVDMSSPTIAALVLEDLAEYVTLAFTRLSDDLKSPGLAAAHRKQDQKITYVALFKTATTKLVEVYYRFKDEPYIYANAVEGILAVSRVQPCSERGNADKTLPKGIRHTTAIEVRMPRSIEVWR